MQWAIPSKIYNQNSVLYMRNILQIHPVKYIINILLMKNRSNIIVFSLISSIIQFDLILILLRALSIQNQ